MARPAAIRSNAALDPTRAAAMAGLRYVSDTLPGFRRRRAGSGFTYLGPNDGPVREPDALRRIRALAIPPAWTDVWICPWPYGHVQATGRDARGRKQFIYHPAWRAVRDSAKYENLAAFGDALPRIRARVADDLRMAGLPRQKVLATVVRLLEETSIRIGNREYWRNNRSSGLTTLRDRHVTFEGSSVRFQFRGKGGKPQSGEINDRRLARIIKQCQDIPGQDLFQYLDQAGERHIVQSDDVNAYLHEISGGDFTAKDFRTWNATLLAMAYLGACEPCASVRDAKHTVNQALKHVAEHLGNTPAVCRRSYVNPIVVEAYMRKDLSAVTAELNADPEQSGLSAAERCMLELLRSAPRPRSRAA